MKKLIITLILLFPILFFYTSYASSFKFTASPEKAYITPGNEISISLQVSDIDAGEDGINVVETTLDYDENIIEKIEFIEKNNWKSTYNENEGNLHGKRLYTKMISGVTKREEIGVLKITIKKNLEPFSTNVKLLQVTSNDGFTLMNEGDKIINLYYKNIMPNPDVNSDTEPTPTPESQTEPAPVTPEEKIPEEPKKAEIPIINNVQTGDIIGFVVVVFLVSTIILVIAIILTHKNKKKNT